MKNFMIIQIVQAIWIRELGIRVHQNMGKFIMYVSFLNFNFKICSFADRNLMFEKIKRGYEVFNNLDLNSTSKIPSIANKNWKNAFKDFSNASYNWINATQKPLDECK